MTEPIRSFSSVPDPDFEDPDLSGPGMNALDALREELAAKLEGEEITLPVPAREKYEIRVSTDVRYEQLAAWRKKASNKDGFNELRFASILVASQTKVIIRDGVELETASGALRFTTPDFWAIFDATSSAETVRAFFGRDADVAKAASAILRAAGFDGEEFDDDSEDPTDL